MVTDNSKGMTGSTGITYNILNLPQAISAKGVTYTYSADGEKLRRAVTVGSATTYTDYIDGIEYDGSAGAETITFIQTEEGRILPTGSTYNYEYNLADHLGDTRITFDTETGVARVQQQDDYMPFGMDISTPPVGNPQNYYLYNKKEWQTSLGLYDYGARFYDPVVPRWTTVDPLAENYFPISEYSYAADNPIRFIDPSGMTFVDPFGLEAQYEQDVNTNKSTVDNILANMNLSDDQKAAFQKFSEGLGDILDELKSLSNSDVVYNVQKAPDVGPTSEGGLGYNFNTKEVTIFIVAGMHLGLSGHEFKHAYQYEKGQVSLRDDNSPGALDDIGDETAAYNRQSMLDNASNYFNGKVHPYTDADIRAKGLSVNPPAYQDLPPGAIDINSPAGKALRQKTIEAGRNGQKVHEAYKGWEKDYAKGVKQSQ